MPTRNAAPQPPGDGQRNPVGDYLRARRAIVQPEDVGGRETQSACVVVADADAHYARATAAGATVVIDIADQAYGGRGYACKDPEGHYWWFGSYDPWAEPTQP